MSLAQYLQGDPRPPWQVLLDALGTADAVMQDAVQVVVTSGASITPDQMDRLVTSAERAAKLSKMTLDANVGERRVQLLESQTALMAGSIQAGLDAVFSGLVDRLGLDPQAEVELRQAALEAASRHAEEAGANADPRGTQRFTRAAGYARARLPSSTAPGSADPQLTQDEIARAQRSWAARHPADQAGSGNDDPQPAGEVGPPNLRVVPPTPPTSPLDEG